MNRSDEDLLWPVWPLFRLIERSSTRAWNISRWAVAGACAAIALWWTGQRALAVVATLS